MTDTPRSFTPLNGFLLGVGVAVVGLIPWILAGWRPPWAGPSIPPDLIDTLLPMSPHSLLSLIGVVVLPGAIVGLVLRPRTTGMPRRAESAATGGRVLVLAIAAVQSIAVVAPRLHPGSPVLLDVAVVAVAVVVLFALSVVVCRVLARRSVPAATVAAAGAALAAGYWASSLASLPMAWMPELPGVMRAISVVATYVPAILTGVALAWCGWATRTRLRACALALLVLWGGGAAIGTLQFAITQQMMPDTLQQSVLEVLAHDLVRGLVEIVAAVLVGVVVRLVAPSVSRFYRARAGATPTA